MEVTIVKIIMDILDEQNQSRDIPIDLSQGNGTALYGSNGVFDSLELVGFLITVEEAVQDNIGSTISLISEKAVSMKRSPFRNVETLTHYVLQELDSADNDASPSINNV